jgi:hypothetical protein
MNLQSLVVVVLRLLSLNFFLTVAVQMAPIILRFTNLSQRGSPAELDVLLAMPWLIITGLIGGAIVLWMFAVPIARAVTRDVPGELSLGRLSVADCYTIVFLGVGLVYMGNHFPSVLNWVHYLIKAAASHSTADWKENVKWYDVSQAVIPFIVGIVLFVNGRKWGIALARRQLESDVPAEPPSEEPPTHLAG